MSYAPIHSFSSDPALREKGYYGPADPYTPVHLNPESDRSFRIRDIAPQPRRRPFKHVLERFKPLILPTIATLYLGFCYAVNIYTVPVTANGIMDVSTLNLSACLVKVEDMYFLIGSSHH